MFHKKYKLISDYFFRHQFARFAVVGSVSAIVDFGILALLTELFGVHYLVSATISFVIANAVNFVLSKYWTFAGNDNRISRQYPIFFAVSVAGLLINNGILFIGVEIFSIYYIFSKAIATVIVMFWNFFMNKHITFSDSERVVKGMRICFFNTGFLPSIGGVATFSHEWAMATVAHPDVESVKVIAFGNPSPRIEKRKNNMEIRTYKTRSPLATGALVLNHMIRNISHDVFHSTNLFPVGFWVVFWSKILRKKSAITFHGTDACTVSGSRITKLLKRWAIVRANYSFAVSESTREKAKQALGYSNASVHVVYSGIPVNTLKSNASYENTKCIMEKAGISNSDFVVMCVNQLINRKGVDYLIKAIDSIDDLSVKLIVIGDGPEKNRLRDLVSILNLESRVVFLGKVPSVLPYYRIAHVCALASFSIEEDGDYEGLGLSLLEAQYMGIPVIGTNSGGIPEAVLDGLSGFIVPEKNSKAIAEKITQLKNDMNLYKKMSDKAKEFILEVFDPQRNIDKYIKILLN